MLEALAAEAAGHGIEVEQSVDCFPETQDDLVTVFVPHEYLPLTELESHPTPRQLARTIAICTEQPGTPWFEEGATVAAHAGAVVDINPLGVRELARRGIAAQRLQLGYVPLWDHWHGRTDSARDFDLVFMGGHTPRRAQALARCGPLLHGRKMALHLVETALPFRAGDPRFLAGERKWTLLRDAKLTLNIHRSELAYMEWHRVLEAMVNGCVVVTEHSIGTAPLEPGVHFVSSRFDNLHLAVGALLEEPEQLRAIRLEAYRYLRDELPLSRTIGTLLDAAETIASRPLAPRDAGLPVPAPRPKAPPWPVPSYLLPMGSDVEILRMGVKHMMMDVSSLRRELAALRDPGGTAPADTVETFGPARTAPVVSVVVTLYNYEEYIADAIESVALSELREIELIVVDDRSRDNSAAVARAALESYPWLTSTLIRRGSNRGLGPGRNLGLEHARGRHVFILDADNLIYPHALAALSRALDENPEAAFAYGILEKFDGSGPIGLESFLEWDPGRLRYSNYIDAMAMLRRDAVVAVGGFVSDAAIYGWEDFALWCTFADAGYGGVRVPEIVARYRVGVSSMISLANVDDRETWSALLRRFKILRPAEA